jgi:hypothetical protein
MPRPRFTPGERTSGTHCTGGWVGPRAGLDTEARGKNPFASAGDRTSVARSFSPLPETILTELLRLLACNNYDKYITPIKLTQLKMYACLTY